ncbi:MAG: DUF1223 domain-containing protein [Reyranellaceae bacterium]
MAATGLALAGTPALARPAGEGPWLVELFTSQGCSSCPPADAHLGRLARRADIVALSFHVDYWDYIGWRDAFATRDTTERQRTYARVLRQRYVYTPEMVVEGRGHDTGREPASIEALLDKARRLSPQRATPELALAGDGRLRVALAAFPLQGEPAEVTAVIYDRRHATPVNSGENQGRMLENFNVVRRLGRVARWDGAAAEWTLAERLQAGQGAAVIVQGPDQGPVLGCNKLEPMVSG